MTLNSTVDVKEGWEAKMYTSGIRASSEFTESGSFRIIHRPVKRISLEAGGWVTSEGNPSGLDEFGELYFAGRWRHWKDG
jgi:hypothetical protein